MSKIYRLITKLLTISLLTLGIVLLTVSGTSAQDSNNTQKPPVEKTQKSTSILEALFSLLKSPENRLITRGDKVCPMSPGKLGANVVWSDRPIFVWSILQPEIPESTINLYSVSANFNYEQDDRLLWSETLAPNSQHITYQEEPLQPGFIYDWKLVFPEQTYQGNFSLMEQSQRELISADITALENQLQASNATSEEKAIAIADYFAQQQLWSDVLQQLYSIENPSSNLVTKRKEMELYLCQSANSEISNQSNKSNN